MSNSWLHYVPNDPNWQPTPAAAEQAAALLREIAPRSDEIECQFHDHIELVHPYANWSGVLCPVCGADIEDWWDETMDAASADHFKNLTATTPCCSAATTLNDLDFKWPTAFGRFGLVAMNPDIEPSPEQEVELAARLGSPLRKVWQHL